MNEKRIESIYSRLVEASGWYGTPCSQDEFAFYLRQPNLPNSVTVWSVLQLLWKSYASSSKLTEASGVRFTVEEPSGSSSTSIEVFIFGHRYLLSSYPARSRPEFSPPLWPTEDWSTMSNRILPIRDPAIFNTELTTDADHPKTEETIQTRSLVNFTTDIYPSGLD